MDKKVAEAVEFFKKEVGLHRLMRLAMMPTRDPAAGLGSRTS